MKLVIFLAALACGSAVAGQVPESRPELGDVPWRRGLDESLEAAARQSKPVLILFQEVPG